MRACSGISFAEAKALPVRDEYKSCNKSHKQMRAIILAPSSLAALEVFLLLPKPLGFRILVGLRPA